MYLKAHLCFVIYEKIVKVFTIWSHENIMSFGAGSFVTLSLYPDN